MKKKISILLYIILLSLTACQFRNGEWMHHSVRQFHEVYGGSNSDYATSIIKSVDGGYLIAGSTRSRDGDVISSGKYNSADAWIIKLDSIGNIVWQKTIGGSGNEYVSSIMAIPDGAYLMVCGTNKRDGLVTDKNNSTNALVVKLNGSGNIVWQKEIEGLSSDYATSIAITADSGYLIAGSTSSKNGDLPADYKQADTQAWLTKLDTSGSIIWQKTTGHDSGITGFPTSITTTLDGGSALAGNTYTPNHGDVNGPHGVQDAWVAKLDSGANIIWQKILGGSSSDYGNSITTTLDGSYVMAGYTSSNDGDVSGNHGLQDAWIVKLNDSSRIVWQKTLGGEKSDYANFIVKTADGGTIMAGRTIIKDGMLTGKGNDDAWIAKLDCSGNVVWQETFGGSGIDDARSAIERSACSYIMAGFSDSIDADVSGNHGNYDAWVVSIKKP